MSFLTIAIPFFLWFYIVRVGDPILTQLCAFGHAASGIFIEQAANPTILTPDTRWAVAGRHSMREWPLANILGKIFHAAGFL